MQISSKITLFVFQVLEGFAFCAAGLRVNGQHVKASVMLDPNMDQAEKDCHPPPLRTIRHLTPRRCTWHN